MFHKLVTENAPDLVYVDRNQFSWAEPNSHKALYVGCECGWWHGRKNGEIRFPVEPGYTYTIIECWLDKHMRELLEEGVEIG